MKKDSIHPGPVCAALAFLGAFVFFQFAYPYHLMRREQLDLFLFDGDYIRQTYRGAGWLARFAGDFLEQFFHLPVAGPLIISLLLTALGAVVYRICRHFLGRWPSLGLAALFFVWSFLRETSNIYMTRYTLCTLGFLSLILLAMQFRKASLRPVAAVVLLAFGAWALGAPFHPQNGRLWSVPRLDDERMIGLDVEVCREHWDRVLKLSEKDLYMEEASYCYNLALAMKGGLGEGLFNHSQNHQLTLLFPVSSERTIFTNSLAGEAWFHLGDMTTAEQSAITSLQASPRHTGARFLVRLARVGLITGEDATAQKYLGMLDKTLFYRNWARGVMPGSREEAVSAGYAAAGAKMPRRDFVHQGENPRSVLLALREADPGNALARDYLLCYDLLCYDLDSFMADYVPEMVPDRLYHEAILIWLSRNSRLNPEQVARYGVDVSMVDRMGRFGRNPGGYKNTYWYYYLKALNGQ
ncbi:MAG: hypothetical protein IKX62_01360 [Bacteroidales bacterium]|nr:hypothetical protein [Bacteroidales bacterium]